MTKWSFEQDLLDTAVAGSTADHLVGAALNGPLDTVFVPGIIGQAVQVGRATGDATVLSALDSADLDLAPSFTIEAFVYRTVEHGEDWERFATKWFDGSENWHWAFRGPPNRSQDLFMNGSQQIKQGAVSADIDLGRWYHVAVSGDPANGLRIWQDGVVVGSAPYLAPVSGTDRFRIGNNTVDAGSFQFSGWVDEFQIHDLSQDGT
ncbi:MAG: LamG-like jellyroll fold domain-containing protein, partial [Verrucomicrobiota bacterium]